MNKWKHVGLITVPEDVELRIRWDSPGKWELISLVPGKVSILNLVSKKRKKKAKR